MEYKGYTATVTYDDEAELFHGEVLHLRDVITFQGSAVDELKQAFHDSVEDYLEFCEKKGIEPQKPFSGRVLLRLEPDLHRAVATAAARCNESVNAWLCRIAKAAVESRTAISRVDHADAVVRFDLQRMIESLGQVSAVQRANSRYAVQSYQSSTGWKARRPSLQTALEAEVPVVVGEGAEPALIPVKNGLNVC